MFFRFAIFSLFALGLAGFGAAIWITTNPAAPPEVRRIADIPPPPALANVFIAAKPLRAGSLIRPEDLGVTQLAASVLPADSVAVTSDSRTSVVGSMLRRSYGQGEVLASAAMMRPGDHGFLAAVLAPGLRAVSVAVDAVNGVAGLIWPGDHVDLLLTQSIEDTGATAGRRFVSETVLTDLRIVAVDRSLVQGAMGDVPDAPVPSSSATRTVTVEVNPAEAERVAVASRLGRLSFSVRSAAGVTEDIAPSRPATWARDVSTVLGGGSGGSVSVFAGPTEKKDFKF